MNFDDALRLTEILLALALLQQSFEYLSLLKSRKPLVLIRIFLCLMLLFGVFVPIAGIGLIAIYLVILNHYNGPFNGGSDRMSLLILICVTLTHIIPSEPLKQLPLGYLAIQLTLSYFMAGWVKLKNPEWRTGEALKDVFLYSSYAAQDSVRVLGKHKSLLMFLSWLVILFELAFPFTLLTQPSLIIALSGAAFFHLANYYCFGLNRFAWIWLAAYPSILWLQSYVFS